MIVKGMVFHAIQNRTTLNQSTERLGTRRAKKAETKQKGWVSAACRKGSHSECTSLRCSCQRCHHG